MRTAFAFWFTIIATAAGLARAATLDAAAVDPPATGGLIIRMMPGSPGERAGLKPGDVITRYADRAIAGHEDLAAAVGANAEATQPLTVSGARAGGEPFDIQVRGGKLGLAVLAAEQGKRLELRPPATDVAYDLAAYRAVPRDEWYAYRVGGAHVGFQHDRVEVVGDKLVVTSELAHVDPKGLRHYLVVVTTTAGPKPKLIEARYEAPLEEKGFVVTLTPAGDGKLLERIDEAGRPRQRTLELADDAMHDVLAQALSGAMPMTPGTCLHYRLLTLYGDSTDPVAVRVGDEADVQVDGQKVRAVPVTTHAFGRTGRTVWVDPATRTVPKVDYVGGTEAVRTTRDAAITGVNPKLKPRT